MTSVTTERKTPQLSVDRRLYLTYALLLFLMFPAHEAGHFLAYRFMGVRTRVTLNTVSPERRADRRPAAELAGPVASLAIAFAGLALWRKYRRRVWAALALAASMMRLVIYAVIVTATVITGNPMAVGNDEPLAARLWHMPTLSILAVLTVPFALVVWWILKDTERVWRTLSRLAVVTFLLGLFVGNVLDPWLFPRR